MRADPGGPHCFPVGQDPEYGADGGTGQDPVSFLRWASLVASGDGSEDVDATEILQQCLEAGQKQGQSGAKGSSSAKGKTGEAIKPGACNGMKAAPARPAEASGKVSRVAFARSGTSAAGRRVSGPGAHGPLPGAFRRRCP